MADPLTEARFWIQVMSDAARTVYCPPDLESRCKGYVDARGLGGLITVVPHPWVPPNVLVVVDRNAVDAEQRQRRQQGYRSMIGAADAMLDFELSRRRLLSEPGVTLEDLARLRLWLACLAAADDIEIARAIDRWEDEGGACR
jgi:hypothetical protein